MITAMLSKKDIKEILQRRFINDIHKKMSDLPLPCELKDIYKAANRIKTAIENNEKILIIGDYDVDGVVSSVIVSEFFDFLGANYETKIPNRFTDGYGLNPQMLTNIDANLIITVDNGISANKAADICLQKKIDLIITDHHVPPPILPKAYAIINPKQSDCTFSGCEICGAEVAWYLIGALKEVCGVKYDMGSFLDILCMAVIADMMELRDINRIIVKNGLNKLNSSKRACFTAIKTYFAKDEFKFDDISFLIDPLINSAGRMNDAMFSYKFLRSKNLNEALHFLNEIVNFNNCRKEEEKNLLENSMPNISQNDNIIVVWGENWHEGVIGIVASRLTKKYKKPAIVFSIDGDKAKGSARSVGKFNILDLISTQKEILCTFGGHKGAAGVVIESFNLNLFKERINNVCKEYDMASFRNSNEILGLLDHNDIDYELLEILEYFEPYGQKNPKPYFRINNAFVKNIKKIGKLKNHLKIIIQLDNKSYEVLFYNYTFYPKIGEFVDIIFSISKNKFRGVITPQLLILDMKISELKDRNK